MHALCCKTLNIFTINAFSDQKLLPLRGERPWNLPWRLKGTIGSTQNLCKPGPKWGLTRQGDLDSRPGVATHYHYTYTEIPAVEQCCVSLCNGDKWWHPERSFHNIPKDMSRRKEWKHKTRWYVGRYFKVKTNLMIWGGPIMKVIPLETVSPSCRLTCMDQGNEYGFKSTSPIAHIGK